MPPPTDLDVAERIVRLETKLDFLINQVDKLPPSPVCLHKHVEIEARLGSIEAWRNMAIGAMMILNIVFIIVVDKIKGLF